MAEQLVARRSRARGWRRSRAPATCRASSARTSSTGCCSTSFADDRVRERRPGRLRPVVELAVGRGTRARAPRSGSTQRNVPAPPKWPNVRGEVQRPRPVRAASPSLSSKPRPQSFGSKRPKPGRTPSRPGNCDRRRLGERLAARRASARAARAARRTRSASEPWTSAPAEPRSSRRIPSGSKHGRARGTRETASPPAPRRARRAPRSPGSSRCGARPDARSAAPSSNGSPLACASRCRTVEPGGPAGSSRSIVPSSTATSVASAVASFVTEAQRKTWSVGPVRARRPRPAARPRRRRARPATRRSGEARPRRAILAPWSAASSRPGTRRTSRSSATRGRS